MNWTKIADSEFHLKQNETLLATMKIQGNKADCQIGRRNLQIRTKGFWGNQIEFAEASGQILALIKPISWFDSRWRFRLYGQDYQLTVRNKPLAEYAVQQHGRDVVAYGLKTKDGRAVAVISDHRGKPLYELDLLLWYLFYTVAIGETGAAATTELNLLLSAV